MTDIDTKRELELFRQLSPDLMQAVQDNEIGSLDDLYRWVRDRLGDDPAVEHDADIGFSSLEEELEYIESLAFKIRQRRKLKSDKLVESLPYALDPGASPPERILYDALAEAKPETTKDGEG